jgi:hypothetical protein
VARDQSPLFPGRTELFHLLYQPRHSRTSSESKTRWDSEQYGLYLTQSMLAAIN